MALTPASVDPNYKPKAERLKDPVYQNLRDEPSKSVVNPATEKEAKENAKTGNK